MLYNPINKMKTATIYLLGTIILLSGCKVQKVVVSPADSQRGDALVSMLKPDAKYGMIPDIHVYAWTQSGELNVHRVFIDFDMSGIPESAIIQRAYLNLYRNASSAYSINGDRGCHGEDSLIIQRVISDWREAEVVWNNQPASTIKNQVVIAKPDYPYANHMKIDITKIIQDIHIEGTNYGIMIRHLKETPYNVIFLASKDHIDKELHPKLEIWYKEKKTSHSK